MKNEETTQKITITSDYLRQLGFLTRDRNVFYMQPFLFVLFGMLFVGSVCFFVAWWIKWGFGIENIVAGIIAVISISTIIWVSLSLRSRIAEDKKERAEAFDIYYSKSTVVKILNIREGILKYETSDQDSQHSSYMFLIDEKKEDVRCYIYGKHKRNERFHLVSVKYILENGVVRRTTFAFNSNQYALDEKTLDF